MRALFLLAAVGILLVGLARSLGAFGVEGAPRSEERTSSWANGNPKEIASFRGFLRHGPCERFHPDGTPRARGRFEAGRMVGEWHFFRPDGSRDEERSGIYADDQRVGPLPSSGAAGSWSA